MRVLMTGTTGFVGKAVVDKFLQEGHSVIAAVRQMSTELPNTVEQVVIGDLAELPKADSSASIGMTGSTGQAIEQSGAEDLEKLPKVDSSTPLGMTDSSGQTVTDNRAVRCLSEALRGVDVVIHMAARVHVMNDTVADPLTEFRSINTEATLSLARQAAKAGVRRFIFLSTIKVNGEFTSSKAPSPLAGEGWSEGGEIESPSSQPSPIKGGRGDRLQTGGELLYSSPTWEKKFTPSPLEGEGGSNALSHAQNVGGKPFDEEDMPNPQDPYAISKWEAEQGLMQIAAETGMEVVIIRPPLIYGPGVKGNFATMIKWLKLGIPLPLGAVHNQRSLLALDNLVSFILLCLEHPKAANQTFVLADGEDVSTSQLLNKIAQAMNKRPWLLPVPVNWMIYAAKLLGKQAVAERLFGSLQIDISKAQQRLGWRPVVSMEEQLSRMNEHEISRRNLP